MPIVYMDDSQEDSARAISSASREECISLDRFKINSYPGPLKDITFVSHTDLTSMRFLDQTPEALAKSLSNGFYHRDKNELEDIYLIACSATLSLHNHHSLAQQFALELEKQGFNRVKVHAVTSPYDLPTVEINVGVANRAHFNLEFVGDINASAYGNTYSQQRDELEDTFRQASDPRKKLATRHQLSQLDRANGRSNYRNTIFFLALNGTYKEELSQPYHTYTKDGVQGQYSFCVAIALKFLCGKKVKLNTDKTEKVKQKYFDFINEFISTLHANSSINPSALSTLIEEEKQKKKSYAYTKILDELTEELKTAIESTKKTTPNYVPPASKTINRRELILKLENYVSIRNKEWDYHYNFLGILSFIYCIFDKLTGTDYFKCFQKNIKISAANKLIQRLKAENPPPLNDLEIMALSDKRLGAIVIEYEGVDHIWNSAQGMNEATALAKRQHSECPF